MKLDRSNFRITLVFAVMAALGGGLAFAVGCGSDDGDGDQSGPGANDKDGATNGDGSMTNNDGGGDGAACTAPNGGLGQACINFTGDGGDGGSNCPCDLACAATKCVARAKCNEALLSWDGPTTNTDGTCLENLAGFVIYSGIDAGAGPFPNVTDAGLPCVSIGTAACGDGGMAQVLKCAYRLGPLANGQWSFAVTTYSDAGVESVPSNIAGKTITCP